MSLNTDLADLFASFAAIMEIKGESPFKAIAFSKVGRILKDMTFDIRKVCEEGKLNQIEGIGKSSCAIIEEFVRTGKSTDFEQVAASVPAGLLPLLDIPGLGPKTIAMLWKQRGVTNLEELVKAIDSGRWRGSRESARRKSSRSSRGSRCARRRRNGLESSRR